MATITCWFRHVLDYFHQMSLFLFSLLLSHHRQRITYSSKYNMKKSMQNKFSVILSVCDYLRAAWKCEMTWQRIPSSKMRPWAETKNWVNSHFPNDPQNLLLQIIPKLTALTVLTALVALTALTALSKNSECKMIDNIQRWKMRLFID